MYTRKFTYTAKDVQCKNCTEHLPGGRCVQKKSPYIVEQVGANSITFSDVLSDVVFII